MLSTNLHPGKTIYECDVCRGKNLEPFRTNFAKELRAHLTESHAEVFPTPGHANDYVLGIFEARRGGGGGSGGGGGDGGSCPSVFIDGAG